MTLAPPVIALTSAPSGGGTLTFAFTSDAGFPLATTTFFVLDPITGAALFEFPGLTPPTAILAGLNETAEYTIIATSFNAGTSEISAPSLPVKIAPYTWSGAGLKNVIHANPQYGARSYQLLDQGSQAVLVDHAYPVFVDDQVFASEEAAQVIQYEVKAFVDQDPTGRTIVRRYRTNKSLCLVTGEVLEINGDPGTGQPTPVNFRIWQGGVPDTNRARIRRLAQRTFPNDFQVEAWPNYLGQWGAYLMSGTVVWAEIAGMRLEFMVPFAAMAELVDIPSTIRSIKPKRT